MEDVYAITRIDDYIFRKRHFGVFFELTYSYPCFLSIICSIILVLIGDLQYYYFVWVKDIFLNWVEFYLLNLKCYNYYMGMVANFKELTKLLFYIKDNLPNFFFKFVLYFSYSIAIIAIIIFSFLDSLSFFFYDFSDLSYLFFNNLNFFNFVKLFDSVDINIYNITISKMEPSY